MSFLDLPYDIREQIYIHLFPRTRHLYLHATEDGPIHLPIHDAEIPTAFLRTCKALNQEASEYLYNGYQFDVVGRKTDCVVHYQNIHALVQKFARDEVHVRAFSNGPDSSTGCISILVGEAKLARLEGRRRGQPTTIKRLWDEEKIKQASVQRQHPRRWLSDAILYWTLGLCFAALCVLLRCLVVDH